MTEIEQLKAERDTLKTRNAELCSAHNALLADGARWQTRAEQAEGECDTLKAERDKWREAYQSLAKEYGRG